MKVVKKKLIEKSNKLKYIFTERNLLIEVLPPHPAQPPLHHPRTRHLPVRGEILFHPRVLSRRRTLQPASHQGKVLRRTVTHHLCRAKFYISQIVLALEYLHSKDIVYRDLKPENIMIDKKGFVKLTDFGLSKKIKRGQENVFSISGMPEYTAPEILFQRDCTKAVDFWCLGSLLH